MIDDRDKIRQILNHKMLNVYYMTSSNYIFFLLFSFLVCEAKLKKAIMISIGLVSCLDMFATGIDLWEFVEKMISRGTIYVFLDDIWSFQLLYSFCILFSRFSCIYLSFICN